MLALAHGAGGGITDNFTTLAAHLPARSLVGLDYPGAGDRQAATAPLTVAGLADELVAAMVAAGHERFPVLGMSLGSAVAVTAAARHPERVTGLVAVVGFAAPDAQSSAFATLYAELATAERTEELARLLFLTAQSPATLAALTPADAEATLRALAEHHEGRGAGLAAHMDLVDRVDVRDLVPQLRIPALVVGAGQDRIVLPSSTRALAEALPAAEYVEFPAAAHVFTPDEDAALAGHVARFLADHRL